MSCLSIDIENIRRINSEITNINRKLILSERKLNYTKRKILFKMPMLAGSLGNITTGMKEEITDCYKYKESLEKIVVLYRNFENAILSNLSPETKERNEQDNLIIGWLKTLFENTRPDSEGNPDEFWVGYDVLSFIRSLFGVVDTIDSNEDIGTIGIFGLLLGAMDGVVNIAENFIEGVHEFYLIIVKSYMEAFGQGCESYDEFTIDGNLSWSEVGMIGIEASIAGLYTMISELTEGVISEDTTGVSAEDMSAVIESACENTADEIAEYIRENQELYEMYQNGNLFEKMVITFFAAQRA